MPSRSWIGAAVLATGMLFAAAVSAQTPIQTPPKAGVTKGEAMIAFANAVMLGCAASREGSGRMADLPPYILSQFQPAADIDRKWSQTKDSSTPVWTTPVMGGYITITETSPDQCGVVGQQLPVEETFKLVLKSARAVHSDYTDEPIKPGYNPIVYQIERVEGGMRYIIHLEGAEPSGLGGMLSGHAFRYSLLTAFVVRQPESAKPPFR